MSGSSGSRCTTCAGKGYKSATCSACGGTGEVVVTVHYDIGQIDPPPATRYPCGCENGEVKEECSTCRGTGLVKS